MFGTEASGERPSLNRRRYPRAKLSVPVHIGRAERGSGQGVSASTAESVELSPGGIYVATKGGEHFVPGDMVSVSVTIPWEGRAVFPFSRIAGSCRVVRVDRASAGSSADVQGVALAFCEQGTMLLGSNMSPL